MKFGSVQFFKRLIVAGYLLLILLPLAAAVVLGVLYAKEKNRADALQQATLAEMAGLLTEYNTGDGTVTFDLQDFTDTTQTPSFPYQTMYPHLYAQRPLLQVAEDDVCYLTFDDGPSTVTTQILDTLASAGIRATFFVTGENSEENKEVLRAVANAGHTIGVHTYSHDYEGIYASVEDFLADFDKMYLAIQEITGEAPEIFRFPGGSVNVYNQKVYTEIVAEMTRRGFVFYDWNASGSDAVRGGVSRQQVVNNVLQSAAGQNRLIVLMHDRADNASTAAALPAVIEGLEKQGYRFEALTSVVEPITYYYTDPFVPNTE